MESKRLLFVHGFASSDRAAKAKYLADRIRPLSEAAFYAINMNPTPADFEFMTVTGMIDRLRQYVLDRELEPLSLIGSSMSGLVAVHYAHRYGQVDKLLLLAPALRWSNIWDSEELLQHWEEAGLLPVPHYALPGKPVLRFDFHVDGQRYGEMVAPAAPTLIIHGRNDDIVPLADSQAYAKQYPGQVKLVELEAGHELTDQLDTIWEQARTFLLEG